jgi:capsule polysaccharide export protein KpsE/RkpR
MLEQYNTQDLLRSLEAEAAKSTAELKTAQSDIDKANSRIRFILAAIHVLKQRYKDNETYTTKSKTPAD